MSMADAWRGTAVKLDIEEVGHDRSRHGGVQDNDRLRDAVVELRENIGAGMDGYDAGFSIEQYQERKANSGPTMILRMPPAAPCFKSDRFDSLSE